MDKQKSVSLAFALLTLSDTRSLKEDRSGDLLQQRIEAAGHQVLDRTLIKDDVYLTRREISRWIADPKIQVIITTGGTGFSGRDSTPEAVSVLLDKQIDGFGELFRQISYRQIGSSTIQSRALAGMANRTLIFCLPGSSNACATAWDEILIQQLDSTHRPCNFVSHLDTHGAE